MKKGLCENGQNFIKGLAEEKDFWQLGLRWMDPPEKRVVE